MRYALFALLLLLPFFSDAQKIARYTGGTPGTDDYTEISFWSDKRIVYKHGSDANERTVQYISATFYQSEKAFIIQLPENITLRVLPLENGRLSLSGLANSYFKMLSWKHEGPLNAKGQCLPCTIDEKEALTILKRTYM